MVFYGMTTGEFLWFPSEFFKKLEFPRDESLDDRLGPELLRCMVYHGSASELRSRGAVVRTEAASEGWSPRPLGFLIVDAGANKTRSAGLALRAQLS